MLYMPFNNIIFFFVFHGPMKSFGRLHYLLSFFYLELWLSASKAINPNPLINPSPPGSPPHFTSDILENCISSPKKFGLILFSLILFTAYLVFLSFPVFSFLTQPSISLFLATNVFGILASFNQHKYPNH